MADPTDPTTPPADKQPPSPPPAPAVDVQAEINKALAAQQAEFQRQLKEATGHGDFKSLTEAQLKEQGKLQELAESMKAEAQSYKSKFEKLAVNNAILTAAVGAVDPSVVVDLLAGKAAVDDAGTVTVDGKPAADAVKALLEAKPFLAKAEGETGSGVPHNIPPEPAEVNPWKKETYNLTEQIRINKENPTLAAQLKAAAGK